MTLFDPEVGAAPCGDDTVRVCMTVAYDGSPFHGFAMNPGVRTVAGTLQEAIQRVLGHGVELRCAGRTDRGVHARGQVVSFDARRDGLDLQRLQKSVNGLCKPSVVVRELSVVNDDFDARFSATGRRYRYAVLNSPVPDPFLHRLAWHVPEPLDLDLMVLACDPLLGEHDFSSFCRKVKTPDGQPSPSLTRRVRDARWIDRGDGVLEFWIEANAFCHQMVRSIVGTMVAVGRARIRPGDMHWIIQARDRSAAGDLAPPDGLCLWDVTY